MGRAAPLRALVASALLLAGVACAGRGASTATRGPGVASATPTVRFLLVNDVYVAEPIRDGTGGLARVAALRDSIERATGSRVLYVLAGDVLSPSLLGKWYGGAQMVDAFNASRLDFAVLGNHEFDGSRANLVARVAESKFRWLSGNCTEKDGAAFPRVRGWDTLTVDGVRVGVYGSVIVREYPSYVQCRNADSSTHALVDTLARVNAQLIVGLTHRNFADDLATLRAEPTVQAILGGHDHTGKRGEVDGRLVIKAVSDARTAALVTFTLRNGAWQRRDTVFPIGPGRRDDPATSRVIAAWDDSLRKHIGADLVIGRTAVAIDGTDSTQHRGESVFGDLITDALRVGTGADVALINSGALRFDDYIAAGPITSHTIESIFLFADETRAITFSLSGARLRQELEHGVTRASLGEGPYLQVSGVQYAYDIARADGQRIVGTIRRADGRVIADTDALRVTMVAYPACRSGDGYHFPEAAAVCRALDADATSAPRSAELVIRHIESMREGLVLPTLGRVTRTGGGR